MQGFIIQSIIASIILTVLINLLPRLFPKATKKVEQQIHDKVTESLAEHEEGKAPKIKVFFPWKTMLAISVFLSILANVLHVFVR